MATPGQDQPSEPNVDDERVMVPGLDEAEPAVEGVTDAAEADALDQGRVVAPRAVHHPPRVGVDASEADALDQAREVPLDEDLDS